MWLRPCSLYYNYIGKYFLVPVSFHPQAYLCLSSLFSPPVFIVFLFFCLSFFYITLYSVLQWAQPSEVKGSTKHIIPDIKTITANFFKMFHQLPQHHQLWLRTEIIIYDTVELLPRKWTKDSERAFLKGERFVYSKNKVAKYN